MEHILLQNSFIYKKRQSIACPNGFIYHKKIGAWVDENYSLLIHHNQFPEIGTKKFDVETGEDHKGQ